MHDFPTAIAATVLAGIGNGAFWPAQSTLLSALTSADERTVVFAANRAAMNMGIGLGGVVGGFIAVNGRPSTYDRLFVIDVGTFVLFAAVVATINVPPAPAAPAHEPSPSFRTVLAVPFFRRLLAVDLATAVTFSLAFELLPIHAAGRLGLANHVIGGFFLVNTFAVAFAQLPMVRILQGRRRRTVRRSPSVGVWRSPGRRATSDPGPGWDRQCCRRCAVVTPDRADIEALAVAARRRVPIIDI